MGRKPWLVSAFVLSLGVAFTGCTGPNKNTSTYKGDKETTFPRNKDNSTAKQPDTTMNPSPMGQTIGGSTSIVSDPNPVNANPNVTPKLPAVPTISTVGDSRAPTTSGFASSQPSPGAMTPVPPPPLPTHVNKPPTDETLHYVQGESRMPQDNVMAPPIPNDNVPGTTGGSIPLPPITTTTPPSSSLPPSPAAVPPLSTPAFNPNSVPPLPPTPQPPPGR